MRKHSFAMIILAFAFSYFCFSCSKDTPKQQYVKNNNTPTQVINDAYLLRSVDGVVDTELKAKKNGGFRANPLAKCHRYSFDVLFKVLRKFTNTKHALSTLV